MPCQSDCDIPDSSLSSVKDNNVQSVADKDPSSPVIKLKLSWEGWGRYEGVLNY